MSGNTPVPPSGNGATRGTDAAADLRRYRAGAGGVHAPDQGLLLGWTMPPSYVPMPHGAYPGMSPLAGGTTGAQLGQGLGNTVRLGIEVVNAVLSGAMSALTGVAQMSPVYGGSPFAGCPHGHHGCGCGCGCESCCGYDCCQVMSCCCQPRVGTCCD